MSRLLIISHDFIGRRMAGVGIRYFEIARALANQGLAVTLAAPKPLESPSASIPALLKLESFQNLTEARMSEWIRQHEVVFAYPDTIWQCREALDSWAVPVVVDGYDITLFEHLEMDADRPIEIRMRWHRDYQQMMSYVLQRGDFFVVGTERQRDFWLGMLAAAGRVNALNYQHDPLLCRLVGLLPYGIPDSPPTHTQNVIRSVLPSVCASDVVVLWGGGAWPWLDPVTLLEAAALIRKQREDFKFIFPGVSHPHAPQADQSAVRNSLRAHSRRLELDERCVFFLDWVPYDQWSCYLVESDIGVSLHREHLESRFSLRTRVLSYIWAGLPMVLSKGDDLAESAAQAGIAVLVDPGDAQATASALLCLAERKQHRSQKTLEPLESMRASLRWSVVVRALCEFCSNPQLAADRRGLQSFTPSLSQAHT